MDSIPGKRQEQILAWLKEDQLLRIDALAERLAVSPMTIHRDLNALVEMSLVEKIHGGVRLPDPHLVTTEICPLCQMPVKRRLYFVLTTRDNETIRTCCPHCGLLLLNNRQDIVTALLRDFIYGRIINARQAHYVIESRIAVCCQPSVLAFVGEADASDFQQGFGGQVMDFETVQDHLADTHYFSRR